MCFLLKTTYAHSMEDAPGCRYYLPGLTEELRSKLFNSWPFSPSIGVDQEPVEGRHFYGREIAGSAQFPLIRAKPRRTRSSGQEQRQKALLHCTVDEAYLAKTLAWLKAKQQAKRLPKCTQETAAPAATGK